MPPLYPPEDRRSLDVLVGDKLIAFGLSDFADWFEQYPQNFSDGTALGRIDRRLRVLQGER